MSVLPTRQRLNRPALAGRARRRVVPTPTDGEEAQRRFCHLDVAELSAAQLFSERCVLLRVLAEEQFRGERDRAHWGPVTRHTWIRERLRRLAAEHRQRRRARVQQ
jgi:hypothetical protein